jgi:hypothetical protein
MTYSFFREKAAECRRNALSAPCPEGRKSFEDQEKNWMAIAERVEATAAADLGSGLIDYSQKMTMAAMQIADMNV